jgi:hypothetical protein
VLFLEETVLKDFFDEDVLFEDDAPDEDKPLDPLDPLDSNPEIDVLDLDDDA